ncbi:ferredoxin [Amycolatopsis sp. H20-H5]|uniref:ferredoxin n=1 Tax=Amycolatopsis sp. H20-H5 TaxID=3046309 RepID=UPI002DBBD8D7|nr:ferredoxin [Amycolatopsis sp. H20-H5]MEC3976046.1 ferredoxin [Amycolatopsis sp. H20-H5]
MKLGRQREGIRVSVDNDRCELYGICAWEAPDVFELGRDGRLRFRRAIDTGDLEQTAAAARLCPTQAVVIRGGLDE